jgi:hypothetical protein
MGITTSKSIAMIKMDCINLGMERINGSVLNQGKTEHKKKRPDGCMLSSLFFIM